MDYSDWTDLQNKKKNQLDINKIYAQAAATASANATESDKVQQKLEQEYRTGLKVAFTSRAGIIGKANDKLYQANSLDKLFEQNYDPKTGNYNIPVAQYAEMALGIASLVSGTGNPTQSEVNNLTAATAKGDFNKLIQYLGGTPQTGNTQAIMKNLLSTIDKEAQNALDVRTQQLESVDMVAKPTDLDPNRASIIKQGLGNMFSYSGQDRVDSGAIDTYLKMAGKTPLPEPITTSDGKVVNNTGDLIVNLLSLPGATNSNVLQYMRDNNYIK